MIQEECGDNTTSEPGESDWRTSVEKHRQRCRSGIREMEEFQVLWCGDMDRERIEKGEGGVFGRQPRPITTVEIRWVTRNKMKMKMKDHRRT